MVDGRLEHLPLRAEPVAVVDQFRIAGHQLVLEVGDAPVEGNRLDGPVGLQQDGPPWSLVGPPGFHTHVPVLDDVGATDTVGPADPVQSGQYPGRGGPLPVESYYVTVGEVQIQVGSLVGGLLRAGSPPPHLGGRLCPGILQWAALVGDVEQVGVHRIGRTGTPFHLNRDVASGCVVQQTLPRPQVPFPPRSDDGDVGVQRVGA